MDHRSATARQYRAAYLAFAREFLMPAPGSALSLDMALAASAWAEFREARDALDAARAKLGGRGISRTAVTRLEQRCRTAEAGYRDARELLGKAAQRALARNRTTTA